MPTFPPPNIDCGPRLRPPVSLLLLAASAAAAPTEGAERRRSMRDQVLDPICRLWEHELYFQERYGNIGKMWKDTPQIRSIRAWIRPD